MKSYCNFVAIHGKNQSLIYEWAVFFMPQIQRNAAIIRLSNLSVTALRKSVMILAGIKVDSLYFFTLIFHSTMARINENASMENNSNHTSTSADETGKFFSFEGTQEVQVVIINGNPYFVATHVCDILGLSNTPLTVSRLDEDEKLLYVVVISGQQRTVNVVNESGLYALIFQSRKPIAKKFRKWVTSEVLPSIRKTGIYATPQAADKIIGQYINVTGADDNLYLLSIFKAFREFIGEELIGNICTELRFVKKYEAAKTLFPEDRKNLRNMNVKINQ